MYTDDRWQQKFYVRSSYCNSLGNLDKLKPARFHWRNKCKLVHLGAAKKTSIAVVSRSICIFRLTSVKCNKWVSVLTKPETTSLRHSRGDYNTRVLAWHDTRASTILMQLYIDTVTVWQPGLHVSCLLETRTLKTVQPLRNAKLFTCILK